MDPVSLERETTYVLPADQADETELRHRHLRRPDEPVIATAPLSTKFVPITTPVVPLREVPDTPLEELPGDFPESADAYSSDEEPTLTDVAKDAAAGVRSAVGTIASAATSFLSNAARRVSRSAPSPDTTSNVSATGTPVYGEGSVARAADHPTAARAGETTGDVIGSVAGTVAAAATKAKDVAANVYNKAASAVQPQETETFATTAPVTTQPQVVTTSTPVTFISPVREAEQQPVDTTARNAGAEIRDATADAYNRASENASQNISATAEQAKQKTGEVIQATKDTANQVYERAVETTQQVSGKASEAYGAGKETASASYSDSYQQAAERTANLPTTIKQTAQSAVNTVESVVESAYAKVAPTIGAPDVETAKQSLSHAAESTVNALRPETIKANAQQAATKAKELATTAEIIAEDAAHKTAAGAQVVYGKTAETGRAVYDKTAETGRKVYGTTSEVVSPAVQVTRESTIASYNQSEAATRQVLENLGEKAVEYGTTAKVLATDALHKVEEVGAAVIHKTVDVAHTVEQVGANTLHLTVDAAHATAQKTGELAGSAAQTASVASHRAIEATAPVVSVASTVAHKAADTTSAVGHGVYNAAATVGSGVYNAAAGATQAVGQGVSRVATGTYNVAAGATRAVGQGVSTVASGTYNAAAGATHAVAEGASNVASGTYNAAAGATRAVGHGVSTVASGTYNAAAGATHAVAEGASNAASGTYNAAAGATRAVTEGASNVAAGTYNAAAGASNAVAQGASNAATAAKDTAVHAADVAGPPAQGVASKVVDTAKAATASVAAIPSAVGHGVVNAASAVGHTVGSVVTSTAQTVAAIPSAVGHGITSTAQTVVAIPSAVGHGISNAVSNVSSGVVAAGQTATEVGSTAVNKALELPSAATQTASNLASRVASVLPGASKPAEEEVKEIALPETGAIIPTEYHQGALPLAEGPAEAEPTPLEDIVYAEEVERQRRDRPGATGRQYYEHSHQEARAFAEGIRVHLGEGGSIPALNVPRRELIREAENAEREERVQAERIQRSVASQQARAFSEGLSEAGADASRGHSAADIARLRQLDTAIEQEREARVESMSPNAARDVALAVKEGIVEGADESNSAVHVARRELSRMAEETARDERTSGPQLETQQTAEKVASLFQAGISGSTINPATDVAKKGQIREAEDQEREERVQEGWKHQPHAHDEARVVREGLEKGVELNPVVGGSYKLNESRKAEEAERNRRLREQETCPTSGTNSAEALRHGLQEMEGAVERPLALNIAEREIRKSQEEDERQDRIQSNDSLRASGSPTQVAFALRAGLLRDDNAAIDLARSTAERDGISDPLNGKSGVGITPSGVHKSTHHGHIPTIFEQSKGESRNVLVPGPTVAFQDWGSRPLPEGSLLGQSSLPVGGVTDQTIPPSSSELTEETGGRRSPPPTPQPTQQESATPFPLPISKDIPESSPTQDRPPTPSRSESVLIHEAPATTTAEQEDSVGLETIRPRPSDDPNALTVPTPPPKDEQPRNRTSDDGSVSSTGSRRFSGEKPNKLHGKIEKAIGRIETSLGKVIHNEHLIAEGRERRAAGAAEVALAKERRLSGSHSPTPP
ncbi:uncharacterized protein SPPG_07742 [Spizellomyces punctatus DAOM BR117]|uniref:Uncharacterized protein n=1 Tax=Spizellomyces punctatus (strain DAOM BR117) TaxID=645134 RepID=A0A0L0H7N8_SPIPD|nr:uncharacterized protein SPPG_07742 [Spizellomyces punctatus DAOM BR117]KNC96916.1 hypothetical protein SPPG_07742 [Spizellomyces punctatus DAOM BR117]|eukprot:XP_016604956.1 hypothetical protein SPPG_07742 [Spizellomyces punctatus DAOM BR117]